MFHPWTIVYVFSGIFCLNIAAYLAGKGMRSSSKKFMVLLLIVAGMWPIMEFFMILSDDMTVSLTIYRFVKAMLSFVPALFVLIAYYLVHDLDKKALLTLIIPAVLMPMVLLTDMLKEIVPTERGVAVIYNIPLFSLWCILAFIPMIAAVFYFYNTYKLPDLSEQFRKKIRLYAIGCMIAISLAYAGDLIGTFVMGLPPFGSIGAAIGGGIASWTFRK